MEEIECEGDERKIRHFLHPQHVLTHIYQIDGDNPICHCSKRIYSDAFFCSECNFWLHIECAEMPQSIHHPFHVAHPLTLLTKPPYPGGQFKCFSCRKIKHGFTLHCNDIDCDGFDLGVCCYKDEFSYLKPKQQKALEFQFFGHQHPLIPQTYEERDELYCKGCLEQTIGVAFSCQEVCFFRLHIDCAKVSQEVQHFCHPEHPLTLLTEPPYKSKKFRCIACRNVRGGFTYHCAECQYDLDILCAALKPSVKHERHEHMLIPFKEVGLYVQCFACNLPCKTDLYRCVACNFNIHMECVSLPSSVIHPRDEHPLVLTPVYLGDDTGLGEYYCDVCEQPRNPDRGVYVCEECVFVAHIECVIPNSKAQVNQEIEKSTTKSTKNKEGMKDGNTLTRVEYAKLDLEIGILHQEVEALNAMFTKEMEAIKPKFKALEDKHVQYVASSVATNHKQV